MAVAIGVALAYMVVDNLFGAMGYVNYLPASMAAWSADVLFGLVGGYLAAEDADVENSRD
jgi:lipopolysaccharide export LptBFGC system permease protein LptF